jgi:hypothetical protein
MVCSEETTGIFTEKSPSEMPLVPSLLKEFPVFYETLTHQFFKTHFEINLPFAVRSPERSTPFRLFNYNYVCISYSAVRFTCPVHLNFLDLISLITFLREVKIMKFPIMQLFSLVPPFYFLTLFNKTVWFLAWARDFSLLYDVHVGSGDQPASYIKGTWGFLPGGKALGAGSWPLISIQRRG